MKRAMGETYSRAGILKWSGKWIAMDIAGEKYFLKPEDLTRLLDNRTADVINDDGERQGCAWLSPLTTPRKADMTSVICQHIYVVSYPSVNRVISGGLRTTIIREFHPRFDMSI